MCKDAIPVVTVVEGQLHTGLNVRKRIEFVADELDVRLMRVIEKSKIVEVLRREGGNKSRAARALGIDRRKLYRLVEKYGIES